MNGLSLVFRSIMKIYVSSGRMFCDRERSSILQGLCQPKVVEVLAGVQCQEVDLLPPLEMDGP